MDLIFRAKNMYLVWVSDLKRAVKTPKNMARYYVAMNQSTRLTRQEMISCLVPALSVSALNLQWRNHHSGRGELDGYGCRPQISLAMKHIPQEHGTPLWLDVWASHSLAKGSIFGDLTKGFFMLLEWQTTQTRKVGPMEQTDLSETRKSSCISGITCRLG